MASAVVGPLPGVELSRQLRRGQDEGQSRDEQESPDVRPSVDGSQEVHPSANCGSDASDAEPAHRGRHPDYRVLLPGDADQSPEYLRDDSAERSAGRAAQSPAPRVLPRLEPRLRGLRPHLGRPWKRAAQERSKPDAARFAA